MSKEETNSGTMSKGMIAFIILAVLAVIGLLVVGILFFIHHHGDDRYFVCRNGECIQCDSSDSYPDCKRGSKTDCQKNCKKTPTPSNLRYKCVGTYDNNVPKTFMIQDSKGKLNADSICNTDYNGWSIDNGQCILDTLTPKYDSLYNCLNNLNSSNSDLYSCIADRSGSPQCYPNPLGNLSKDECLGGCNSNAYGWGVGPNNKCVLGSGHGNYSNISSCIDSLLPQ